MSMNQGGTFGGADVVGCDVQDLSVCENLPPNFFDPENFFELNSVPVPGAALPGDNMEIDSPFEERMEFRVQKQAAGSTIKPGKRRRSKKKPLGPMLGDDCVVLQQKSSPNRATKVWKEHIRFIHGSGVKSHTEERKQELIQLQGHYYKVVSGGLGGEQDAAADPFWVSVENAKKNSTWGDPNAVVHYDSKGIGYVPATDNCYLEEIKISKQSTLVGQKASGDKAPPKSESAKKRKDSPEPPPTPPSPTASSIASGLSIRGDFRALDNSKKDERVKQFNQEVQTQYQAFINDGSNGDMRGPELSRWRSECKLKKGFAEKVKADLKQYTDIPLCEIDEYDESFDRRRQWLFWELLVLIANRMLRELENGYEEDFKKRTTGLRGGGSTVASGASSDYSGGDSGAGGSNGEGGGGGDTDPQVVAVLSEETDSCCGEDRGYGSEVSSYVYDDTEDAAAAEDSLSEFWSENTYSSTTCTTHLDSSRHLSQDMDDALTTRSSTVISDFPSTVTGCSDGSASPPNVGPASDLDRLLASMESLGRQDCGVINGSQTDPEGEGADGETASPRRASRPLGRSKSSDGIISPKYPSSRSLSSLVGPTRPGPKISASGFGFGLRCPPHRSKPSDGSTGSKGRKKEKSGASEDKRNISGIDFTSTEKLLEDVAEVKEADQVTRLDLEENLVAERPEGVTGEEQESQKEAVKEEETTQQDDDALPSPPREINSVSMCFHYGSAPRRTSVTGTGFLSELPKQLLSKQFRALPSAKNQYEMKRCQRQFLKEADQITRTPLPRITLKPRADVVARRSCDRFNNHATARESPSLETSLNASNSNLAGMNCVTPNPSLFGMDIAYPAESALAASTDGRAPKMPTWSKSSSLGSDPSMFVTGRQDRHTLERRMSDTSYKFAGLAFDGTCGDRGHDVVTPPPGPTVVTPEGTGDIGARGQCEHTREELEGSEWKTEGRYVKTTSVANFYYRRDKDKEVLHGGSGGGGGGTIMIARTSAQEDEPPAEIESR